MNNYSPILLPGIVLVLWTMFMWLWMYITRIPAIYHAKMKLDRDAPRGEQMNTLPPRVRWKADNYNHLLEQPTVFYPIIIILAMMGAGDGVNLTWAWAYVILRVIHSFFQSLVNIIEIRFTLFVLSSITLIVLAVNALGIFLRNT